MGAASQFVVSVVLQALDQLSRPVQGATRTLGDFTQQAGRTSAPLREASRHSRTLGDAVSVLTRPLAGASRGLADVRREATSAARPVQNVTNAVESLTRATERYKASAAFSAGLQTFGEGAQRFGAYTTGAGLGAAAATGLLGVPGMVMRANRDLTGVAITTGASDAELRAGRNSLLASSRRVNQELPALVEGVELLTAAGYSFEDAVSASGNRLGKLATAYRVTIADLAKTEDAARTLGVRRGQEDRFWNIVATGGKLGKFETPDMARALPGLAPVVSGIRARAFERDPMLAAASTTAALQVARMGAATAEAAENNYRQWLEKLSSPEVAAAMATKFGVNWSDAWERIRATSADPIVDAMALIGRITRGKDTELAKIFTEEQSRAFARIYLQMAGEYQRIREEALRTDGAVDADFSRAMRDASEQLKQLRINLAALAVPELDGPVHRLNQALHVVNANPALQRGISWGIAGLLGMGATSLAVGTVAKVLSPLLTMGAGLRLGFAGAGAARIAEATKGSVAGRIGATLGSQATLLPTRAGLASLAARDALSAGRRGLSGAVSGIGTGALNLFNGARTLQVGTWAGAGARIVGVLRMVLTGVRALGVVLAANPIGLAVAAGAFLIFKFWRPIVAFMRGVGKGIGEALRPLAPTFTVLGGAMRPIVAAVRDVVGWVWKLIAPVESSGTAAMSAGEKFGHVLGTLIRWAVELPAKFMTFGANIVVALAQGIKSMATEPVKYIREIGASIMRFFPQSPAKEGPLRKLHQLKWGETIAVGIKPGPVVAAMRGVAAAAVLSAVIPSPARADVLSLRQASLSLERRSAGPGRSAGAGGDIVIHVQNSPRIEVQGSTLSESQLERAIENALTRSNGRLRHALDRAMRAVVEQRQRISFRDRGDL